ncbi:Protein CBG27368 [Caenorhabditis briggsae]|uniref:Protein CBG27368 n=1 Tax=Caenorhabditis briggsae TaxID=6238 RepID=B6IGG8_CAEBR|nr:Protein CBG27368 [Caenorhabditis briggsae]CAR98998.1 Protein CBG27368 [Caenorhabditis briggsae]
MFWIHWIWVCFMLIYELPRLITHKVFWRNRNARTQSRKESQRLGYPSVVSVFQNLSKEKRDQLADKCPFFNQLDKRIPYHWDCVGHIVFDLFFKTWKLRHY